MTSLDIHLKPKTMWWKFAKSTKKQNRNVSKKKNFFQRKKCRKNRCADKQQVQQQDNIVLTAFGFFSAPFGSFGCGKLSTCFSKMMVIKEDTAVYIPRPTRRCKHAGVRSEQQSPTVTTTGECITEKRHRW